ncbi:MAG: hypothetical protein AAGA58_13235, partial [Verrucomicrobiota bacterium]
ARMVVDSVSEGRSKEWREQRLEQAFELLYEINSTATHQFQLRFSSPINETDARNLDSALTKLFKDRNEEVMVAVCKHLAKILAAN